MATVEVPIDNDIKQSISQQETEWSDLPKESFLKKNNLFLSILIGLVSLILFVYHYVIVTEFGTVPMWGIEGPLILLNTLDIPQLGMTSFSLVTLSNTQFFAMFGITGSLLIILSSVIAIRSYNPINGIYTTRRHKQSMFFGFFLIFLGLIGYYYFIFLEPFLAVYLMVIFSFYSILSIEVVQPTYNGYSTIIDLMPWDDRTIVNIREFCGSLCSNEFITYGGTFEITMTLIVLVLILIFILLIKNPSALLSAKTVKTLSHYSSNPLDYSWDHKKVRVFAGLILIAHLLFAYGTLFKEPALIISPILLLLVIPLTRRKSLMRPLFNLRSYKVTLYEFYIFLYLIGAFAIAVESQRLTGVGNNLLIILSVFLLVPWIRSRFINKNNEIHESDLHVNLSDIGNLFLIYSLILYFGWWLFNHSNELFGLELIVFAIIIRFGSKIIMTFGDPSLIRYSLRRILVILPMFIGISILVYAMMTFAGNPVDLLLAGRQCGDNPGCLEETRRLLNARFGFDSSPTIQWYNWFFHFLQGDLGQELIIGGSSVAVTIQHRILPTLELAILPLILSTLIAVPLGILAAKRQYSKTDNGIAVFVALGVSIPIYFLLILFILFFSGVLDWVPAFGRLTASAPRDISLFYADWFSNGIPIDFFGFLNLGTFNISGFIKWTQWDFLFHLIIPVTAVTMLSLALFTRLVRSGMLEVLRQDYILSARASGFSERAITNRYALRNVLIPLVTFLGLSLGGLLGGTPITETVISWPGLGTYAVLALTSLDYGPLMATTMIVAFMIMLGNLFTDILYSVVDPRIRIE